MLADEVVATSPALGAEANLEQAIACARRVAGEHEIVALGACTFGIPRPDGVALSPAIPGWERLPLRRELESAFGVPVALVTDVKAAAAAEIRSGALAGVDTAIYLNLGTGLAVALVVGGAVVTGANGASGEIGYCVPSAGTGILEDIVSGMALQQAAHELGSDGVEPGEFRASAVFEWAAADGAFRSVTERFVGELCLHLVNLAIALDPECIAVGGGLVRAWDHLEPALRAALDAHVPYPPRLTLGAFPFDAALRGAIDLGVELARSLPAPVPQ